MPKMNDRTQHSRLLSLDGFRGVCAVIIALIHHYYRHFSAEVTPFHYRYWNILASNGYLIVELFFVISGFVIAYNYKNKIYSEDITFGSFFGKRMKHIYPVYLIALLLVSVFQAGEIVVAGIPFVFDGYDFYHFLLNLFCIQTGIVENSITFNGPAWCISVELLCYAIWYFLAWRGKKNKTFYYVSCVCLIIFGLMILRQGWNLPLINSSVARGYTCFFLGALLMEANEVLPVKLKYRISVLGITASLLMVMIDKMRTNDMFGGLQFCFIVLFAPVIVWSVLNVKVIKGVFEAKPLVYLGKLSLVIYLIHFPIQCAIHLFSAVLGIELYYGSLSFYVFYCLCVLGVSALLYEIVVRRQNLIWRKIELYAKGEAGQGVYEKEYSLGDR